MSSNFLTFHKILAGCEAGSREAWQAFVGNYTRIVFRLLEIYRSASPEERQEIWRETLGELSARDGERLRAFDQQAEREFLVDLRGFLLERSGGTIGSRRDMADAPPPTFERVRSLLAGLPFAHREIMFLKLAGYSDRTLEELLGITPGVAQKGLERLREDYAAILGRELDLCLWPSAWCELLRQARTSRQETCPPLRGFVRVLDGQTSWYDKNPLEQHATDCPHCFERWTALREVIYWRRAAPPLPPSEVEPLLASLPLRGERKGKGPLLKRIFG